MFTDFLFIKNLNCQRLNPLSLMDFRRMCGHFPKEFSPSWATNRGAAPSAQVKLNLRWQWANPGKNMGTGTRRRKCVGLPSIWMPDLMK